METRFDSLRWMARATLAFVTLFVVALVFVVLFASGRFSDARFRIADSAMGLEVATRLDGQLEAYGRLSGLHELNHEAGIAVERERVVKGMLDSLAEANRRVDTETERRVLGDTRRAIDSMLAHRAQAEAQGGTASDITAAPDPASDDARRLVRDLYNLNSADLDRENAAVELMRRRLTVAGLVVVAGLLAIIAGLLGAANRYIYRPLVDLSRAMRFVGQSETQPDLPERLPAELSDVVSAFRALTKRLAWQRQNELAYLAGVAHDLRNPLGAMAAAISVVRTDAASDAQRTRTLELMQRQIERLGRMAGDLCDMARIESGKLELRRSDHDLRDIARDAAELYRPVSDAHVLGLDLPDAEVRVSCDAERIEQVLGNLITNAIKYTPGGGRIEMRVASDGAWTSIAVADQGIGIPAESMEEIFAPFWRRRLEGRPPGVGLGLSVAKRIVEGHGGRIIVESTEGAGSTFTLRLPRTGAGVQPRAALDVRDVQDLP